LYYTDANSSQWVAATSDPVNIGVVANQSERDAQYPTPGQGMRVYRTDLGVTQTYYGLYNVSTNPGGRDVAGWYDTEKNVGLVPIQPSSVTIVTGTGSANSLGQASFTGATKITLQNIFSALYDNYVLILTGTATASTALFSRLVFPNNSEETFTAYGFQGLAASATTLSGFRTVGAATMEISFLNSGQNFSTKAEIYRPFVSTAVTQLAAHEVLGVGASAQIITYNSQYAGQASYSGLAIYPSTGSITGTIQVFGYND
jgi:hypothetical protein